MDGMTKTFPASLDTLYEMLDFVKERAAHSGFSDKEITLMELAAEEALVNIISYGYPQNPGNITIECHQPQNPGLQIIIRDRGIAYNPLTNSKYFDIQAPLEERTMGGYGIYIILKIMDEVEYKREDLFNVLTMTKYLA